MLRWIPSLSFYAPRIMIQRRPLWLAVFFIYLDHILSYFSKMKRKSLQGHLFIDFYKEKSVSYCTCFFFFYLQVADALYYNASLTLSVLQKLGVATEFFNLWFHMLQQVKKSGVRANFRR